MSASELEPTEEQGRVLHNIANGFPAQTNFARAEDAVRASFECLSAGWLSGGQLTAAGRKHLGKPRKTTKFEVTVLADGGRKDDER